MNAKARYFWQNSSPKPRRTCWFMDWQELCWCNALHGYLALKEHGCRAASKVWSHTCTYHSALPGRRDRNHLRSLSVQQTPTAGAKDQFCRGLWRPLEQALQRVKMVLGTPQSGCYFLIQWSFFRKTGLLNSTNWNNQIIKAVARPLLTKGEQHFAWSQERWFLSCCGYRQESKKD